MAKLQQARQTQGRRFIPEGIYQSPLRPGQTGQFRLSRRQDYDITRLLSKVDGLAAIGNHSGLGCQ
jgi:hypothetical protein